MVNKLSNQGMTITRSFIVVLLLCSAFKAQLAFAQSTPNFYISYVVKGGIRNAVATQVLTEIYRDLGYRAVFNHIPARRSLQSTNDGLTDAEIFRVAGLSAEYPNLVRIKAPLFEVEHFVFTLEKNSEAEIAINEYDDLNQVKLGFFSGHKYAENLLAQHAKEATSISVADNEQLFGMLMKGRIDGVITTQAMVDEAMRRYPAMKLKRQDIELPTTHLYHYINRKHKDLRFAINKKIKQYHRKGKIEALLKQATTAN